MTFCWKERQIKRVPLHKPFTGLTLRSNMVGLAQADKIYHRSAFCISISSLFVSGRENPSKSVAILKDCSAGLQFPMSRVVDDIWKLQGHVLQLDPSCAQNVLSQIIAKLQPQLERLSWFTKAQDNRKRLPNWKGSLIGDGSRRQCPHSQS
jgi:hypothetical protein